MEPSLPSPPWLMHLLLEDPFWAVLSLLAIGAALYVLAGRMARPALQKVSLVPVIAALGVLALALIIHTDREAIADRTLALAEWAAAPSAVPPGETPEDAEARRLEWIDRLLDPGLMLQIEQKTFDRPRVLQSAKWVVRENAITDIQIQDLQVHLDHPRSGRSLLRVRAWTAGRPVRTSWMLYWQKASEEGEWKLRQIEWISFEGQKPAPGLLP